MVVKVRYFGMIAEEVGMAEETVSISDAEDLEQLKSLCFEKYQGLSALIFQIAVNQVLTSTADLKAGDEVAFLPPFAGG